MTAGDRYAVATALADALEAELKRLDRWAATARPPKALENMGAFGQGTLSFHQWLQFVLVPRLREIVRERGEFPCGSQVGVYAVRELDGDPDAGRLIALLQDVDEMVEPHLDEAPVIDAPAETIRLGGTRLPSVVYTLIGVLPKFEGEDLEAQLETYDTYLEILSPVVRPELSALLLKAAAATADPASRARIERAAQAVAGGGRAAAR